MKTKKRILVAPLDWGLGHATRCIPVIKELLKQGAEVFVAASEKPLRLLQQEFSDLEFIRILGYDIHYPKNGNMIWQMAISSPKIMLKIKKEHQLLKKLIERYAFDGIISDNRYGLWNEGISSVIITHQIFIQLPLAKQFLHKKTRKYLSNFDQVWIPDFKEEPTLSGELSHGKNILKNVLYINPLSRFEKPAKPQNDYKYDVMAILSGPEPQRSILEAELLSQLKKSNLTALVVRGMTETKQEFLLNENIEVLPHIRADEMFDEICQSKYILSRSGYSTIMDLAVLQKKAVLIPTPGQTEQEYLAKYHSIQGHFLSQKQSDFNLKDALKTIDEFEGLKIDLQENILKKVVREFLEKL